MRYGITRKWITSHLSLVVLLLAAAEALFVAFMHSTYYDEVRRALDNRYSIIAGSLQVTGDPQSDSAEAAGQRERLLRQEIPFGVHDYPIPWVLTEAGLFEDGTPSRLE